MYNDDEEKDIEMLDETPNNNDEEYNYVDSQISQENQNSENIENAANIAAEVAKKTPNPTVKAAGHIYSAANKVTGGAVGKIAGKVGAEANRTMNPSQMANFNGSKVSFANKRLLERGNSLMSKKNTMDKQSLDNTSSQDNAEKNDGPSLIKQAKNMAKDEVKAKAKKAVVKLIASNPWILLIIGIIIILLLIIIIFSSVIGNEITKEDAYGLSGYKYYQVETQCDSVYTYNTKPIRDPDTNKVTGYEPGPNDGTYPLEEYIAGVVAAEVGGFSSDAIYEAFAIAARTFAISNFNRTGKCSIAGNATRQAFIKTSNEKIINAVANTKGLILTRNEEIFTAQYDAFCWDKHENGYYYVCQGNYDTGEPLLVPEDWVKNNVYSVYLSAPRTQAHGNGMSQFGAYYLATEQNFDSTHLLKYFYGSEVELMSIYKSFSYSGEYEVNPLSERYQNLSFIYNISLEELLEKNGTSFEEYNSYIKGVAQKAGIGSRAAVVNSAVSLIGSLADFGYKLPYQWGGKYYFIGANRSWGTKGNTDCNNYASEGYEVEKCLTNYQWTSFDCSGFVNWAIINGFQFSGYTEEEANGAYQKTDFDNTIDLNPNYAVCQPGDVLVNEHHIVLVVGLDNNNKNYIVAESTGSSIATNNGGVKLSYYSYGNTGYKCRSLDNIYKKYRSTVTSGTLLVGDSRMVGSCNAGSVCNNSTSCNTDACIAKQGAGITWFKGVKDKINSNNRRNIVINMGVNDLVGGNASDIADKYWNEYADIAKNNTNKKVYILSVNPTKESSSVDPNKIIEFNNRMKSNINNSNLFNISYLDSFNNINFNFSGDGLHYSNKTYKDIFNFVMGAI